jgi:hypothetical protein
MPVTNGQMIWLRAYLAGEREIARRVNAEVAASVAAADFTALVYTAFVIAARRKFSPTWTRGEVIRFVAQVRALPGERLNALVPLAAEHQLRSALGERMTGELNGAEAAARAQLILLDALVQGADLDDGAVIDLLNLARETADRILAGST